MPDRFRASHIQASVVAIYDMTNFKFCCKPALRLFRLLVPLFKQNSIQCLRIDFRMVSCNHFSYSGRMPPNQSFKADGFAAA
ncbi:hypothetical protein B0E48_17345 [Rhodanobacter sp. C03]|nr:hypothetical protein B0E48_17345 [Rhodanobacter sp. C03]